MLTDRAPKVICEACKDKVLRVIEEHLQRRQEEITKLVLSSSGDDLVKHLAEELIQIGAKSVKYRIGEMLTRK